MKVHIVYPVPFDNWEEFRPHVARFTNTLKRHPAGRDYTLWAVANWGEPTDSVREMFYGLKTFWLGIYEDVFDGGSWQRVASMVSPNDFLVCCTSRVYFHRAGWLNHLMTGRNQGQPGIYSTSASREICPHPCLRCFGVDALLLREYPNPINTRQQGLAFETGKGSSEGSFSDIVERDGYSVRVVYWSGIYDRENWFSPDNIFRKGDQSNLLVFDRHTEQYDHADESRKKVLNELTYG